MHWQIYTRRDSTQILGCLDLCAHDAQALLVAALPQHIHAVYSDPPWNPGNAQWWRRHAGAALGSDYAQLLHIWHEIVGTCCLRGAQHVLCEQSINTVHCQMFFDSRHSWELPWQGAYQVFYGSPGSTSVRRPNTLLHFGAQALQTDPTGMAGEPMTIRVCAGLGLPSGAWLVDPCIGKGMISRMAHYFGWNCFGTELNAARLAVACAWLEKQGYTKDA